MADTSVFINGVADGIFTDALNGLPPWATENTLYKIQGTLEKTLGIQNKLLSSLTKGGGSGTANLTPKQLKDLGDELAKATKDVKDANKEADKQKKARKQKEDEDKKSILTAQKLRTSGEKLTYVLTGLAAIGGKVLAAEAQYVTSYDALYKSGLNVLSGNKDTTDGLTSLNQMVNLTGMRLETLQKTMLKYSETINAVGPTKFTKALAKAIPQLNQLGYTSEESSDLMASYLDIQRNVTDVRLKSDKEITASSVRFGRELGELSLATGKSRDQLLENMKTTAQSNDFALIAADKGDTAATNILEFSTKFGKGTQDLLMRFASSSAAELTDQFQALNAAGQGALASQLKQVSILAQTDKAAAQQMIEGLKPAIDAALGPGGGLKELRDSKFAGADETVTALAELRRGIVGQSDATSAQTKSATDAASATASLATQLEKLAAAPQAAFSPMVSQIKLATDGLTAFNNALYGAIHTTDANTRSWIGLGAIVVGFGASLAILISKVGRFASLFEKIGNNLGSSNGGFSEGRGKGSAGRGKSSGGTGVGSAIKAAGVGAALTFATDQLIDLGKASMDWWKASHHEGVKLSEESKKRIAAGEVNLAPNGNSPTRIAQGKISEPVNVTVDTSKNEKNEKSTTVDSPSAGTAKETDAGKPATPPKSDINSQMAFQSNVLEQILLSTNNLVSVNKDILKYTKIAS